MFNHNLLIIPTIDTAGSKSFLFYPSLSENIQNKPTGRDKKKRSKKAIQLPNKTSLDLTTYKRLRLW
jgi:hypothetical protein